MKRKIRVGLDLDGVLVDKPPLIPKRSLEWLVRAHNHNRALAYRFPQSKWEQRLRWLSHMPCLRPGLAGNIMVLKESAKQGQYDFFLISGRYSFLQSRTEEWLKRHGLVEIFKETVINLNNEQPHLFKEKQLRRLKIDVFIDDDPPLATYLARKLPRKKVFCLDYGLASTVGPRLINSLNEAFPL